jgi:hypothetical protein
MPSYQLRHKQYGVFQGVTENGFLWDPISGAPEAGYHEFKNKKDVSDFVKRLTTTKLVPPLRRKDLSIELFDKDTSEKLKEEAKLINLSIKVYSQIGFGRA